mgnify:CR=1 FL=1
MNKEKTLQTKLLEAKKRTKFWSLGVESIEFPYESFLNWREVKKMAIIDNSEIINLGRGRKRFRQKTSDTILARTSLKKKVK